MGARIWVTAGGNFGTTLGISKPTGTNAGKGANLKMQQLQKEHPLLLRVTKSIQVPPLSQESS